MKNFLIFVFSLLFAISCKKAEFTGLEAQKDSYNQYGNPNIQPDSLDGWQVDTTHELVSQNFVTDTSYTSLPSALESEKQIAKMMDENAYKASLINDKLVTQIKATEKAISRLKNMEDLAKERTSILAKKMQLTHEQETLYSYEPK